jgi:hypothetical protein
MPLQPRAVGAGPNAVVTAIPDGVWGSMVGRTWHTGCPVGRSGLRLVRINYWDYTGYRRRGEIVLAAESLLGLAGLGLATGLLLGPIGLLLGGADPAYLPSPWWEVDRLSPHQASLRLLQHDVMGIGVAAARWWLVLTAWLVIAVLTLLAARQERPATRRRPDRT